MDETTKILLHDAMDAMLTDDRDEKVIASVAKRICAALGHQWPPYVGTGWTEDDCPVCEASDDPDIECDESHMRPCCTLTVEQHAASFAPMSDELAARIRDGAPAPREG